MKTIIDNLLYNHEKLISLIGRFKPIDLSKAFVSIYETIKNIILTPILLIVLFLYLIVTLIQILYYRITNQPKKLIELYQIFKRLEKEGESSG